jgi:dTDP-4-amino-4,6-dideoxygalactose transaminase
MKTVPVTKPFLPPIEEYMAQVKRAYDNEWLTNRGELVLELETKIQEFLGSKSKPIAMNNGTIPLQIAIKLLGGGGEIITTPFSYVATTSTILWEGCIPVFVDINPVYWTIDETKIEEAITDRTTCILATHVFGNPCNVVEIERIAKKHNLYVIYDAAHCFGVKYKGKSIFDWGDISTCSFHATKIFHTGEGGAAFVNNQKLFEKVFYSHNFGHNGPTDFHGVGINGKMSELQAAMGLAILPYFENIYNSRKDLVERYNFRLEDNHIKKIWLNGEVIWNYSYYPVLFENEYILKSVLKALDKFKIQGRRYFFPSLNTLSFIDNGQSKCLSESISKRILCLPIFNRLSIIEQDLIIDLVNKNSKSI